MSILDVLDFSPDCICALECVGVNLGFVCLFDSGVIRIFRFGMVQTSMGGPMGGRGGGDDSICRAGGISVQVEERVSLGSNVSVGWSLDSITWISLRVSG
jgi:hypothetical protein